MAEQPIQQRPAQYAQQAYPAPQYTAREQKHAKKKWMMILGLMLLMIIIVAVVLFMASREEEAPPAPVVAPEPVAEEGLRIVENKFIDDEDTLRTRSNEFFIDEDALLYVRFKGFSLPIEDLAYSLQVTYGLQVFDPSGNLIPELSNPYLADLYEDIYEEIEDYYLTTTISTLNMAPGTYRLVNTITSVKL